MHYRVVAETGITFHAGAILHGLTAAQVARRPNRLDPIEGDRHRVLEPVMFKRGELVGVDGDVPKAALALLEDPDAPGQPLAAAKKTPARAEKKGTAKDGKKD